MLALQNPHRNLLEGLSEHTADPRHKLCLTHWHFFSLMKTASQRNLILGARALKKCRLLGHVIKEFDTFRRGKIVDATGGCIQLNLIL